MKLPFTCPNISLSRRFSGIAAQLTATHGRFARVELRCIVLAITSLPVPLSPLMSTVAAVGATFCMVSHTLIIMGDDAMKFSKRYRTGCSGFTAVVADFAICSSARFKHAIRSSTLNGFVK